MAVAASNKLIDDLRIAANAHCAACKGTYFDKTGVAVKPLLIWLGFLRTSVSRRTADRLLGATQAAAVEVATYLSLGLVRPAVFSIRAQLEFVLAWIYFNDHPVEWGRFEKDGKGYQLPAAITSYLNNNSDSYQRRFKILSERRKRKHEEPYGILSVHVHGTSAFSAPAVGPPASLVRPSSACDDCINVQVEVVEYLTDVLAAWYTDYWHDLPSEVTAELKVRLTPPKLKEFCK